MASFLLFVFVFASQVIGGFNTKLPAPAYGNTITILSIDGGGIKGILPTVILQNLESALQTVSNDKKAALADYFDVIAGTSTGGIIATMLAAPNINDTSRPAFTTPEILEFYLKYGPSIFNQTSASGWTPDTPWPKYDGEFLHDKVREILQGKRLHDTLTNLVVPTFDIWKLHPVIFSSFKKDVPGRDAKLSDICIGTSAAPTQLPPYYFINGILPPYLFSLVDGFVTAASPALIAVSEVIQHLNEKNSDFIPAKANEKTKIVLLSIGTGRNGVTSGAPTVLAKNFTANNWTAVIAGSLAMSAGNMNEYHLKSVFPDLPSSDNYHLRIEEYNLNKTMTSDNVTKESMDNLIKAGEDLLKQTVKSIDINSFDPYEKPSEGTNAEALKRLAETLYNERQLRLKMKSMEKKKSMKKMGQEFIEAVTSRMYGMK